MTTRTATDTTRHACPYPRCPRTVSVHMLACRTHWYTVSKPTRDAVWAGWHGDGDHAAAIHAACEEMRAHARARGITDDQPR